MATRNWQRDIDDLGECKAQINESERGKKSNFPEEEEEKKTKPRQKGGGTRKKRKKKKR